MNSPAENSFTSSAGSGMTNSYIDPSYKPPRSRQSSPGITRIESLEDINQIESTREKEWAPDYYDGLETAKSRTSPTSTFRDYFRQSHNRPSSANAGPISIFSRSGRRAKPFPGDQRPAQEDDISGKAARGIFVMMLFISIFIPFLGVIYFLGRRKDENRQQRRVATLALLVGIVNLTAISVAVTLQSVNHSPASGARGTVASSSAAPSTSSTESDISGQTVIVNASSVMSGYSPVASGELFSCSSVRTPSDCLSRPLCTWNSTMNVCTKN